MASDFELRFDSVDRRLCVRLSGYWTEPVFNAFEAAITAEIARLQHGSVGAFDLLVDARDHGIQSQDLVGRIRSMDAQVQRLARRTAVVVTGSLQKMQARRIHDGGTHRTFTSLDEATRWLAEGG